MFFDPVLKITKFYTVKGNKVENSCMIMWGTQTWRMSIGCVREILVLAKVLYYYYIL